MKIAVICGGLSKERDVSISTGTGAANALRSCGHSVALIDLFLGCAIDRNVDDLFTVSDDSIYSVKEEEPDLEAIRAQRSDESVVGPGVFEVCKAADIVFLALHGAEGENGKLQAYLDLMGVKYTGSGYLGSALAMDKELSKILFRNSGILTPEGITLYKNDDSYAEIGYPCVVKPCSGGSSVGTSIVNEPSEYTKALNEAFACEEAVIVEKYVKGREFTVGVMDGKAMAVIEIIPKAGFYDYKHKYQKGWTEEVCPAKISAELTEKLQELAERVYRVLRLEAYGRIDFLQDSTDGCIYCLEANTLPGMTPTSLIPQMAAAEGISYAGLCEEIIRVSMKKYAND